MPVILPDFVGRRCKHLNLCGRVDAKGVDPPAAFTAEGKNWQVAQYDGEAGPVLLRAGLTRADRPDCMHLHFDVSPKSAFEGMASPLPALTADIDAILDLLNKYQGKIYQFSFFGKFEFPDHELMPVPSGLVFPFGEEAGIGGEMVAATVALPSGPVSHLDWDKGRVPGRVLVTLSGKAERPLGDDLLEVPLADTEVVAAALLRRETTT